MNRNRRLTRGLLVAAATAGVVAQLATATSPQ
jgi:hypothetical protein